MNPTQPLGLPAGSVRAILALLIVGSTIVFNGIAMLTGNPTDPMTVGLAGMVVGYYFAKRGDDPADEYVPAPVDEDEV